MKKYIEKDFKETEIGKIPQDWEIKEIGEIFEIKAGGDLSKISFSKIKDEKFIYPVYSNSLRNKGIYGFSKDFQYEENAITITARGEVGKAEFRNHKFNAIIRLLVLKPKIKINCYFVSNFINSKLKFYSVGTSQNQLTIPMLSKRIIALPPLSEQKNIAKILGDLDAKIENNNEQNEIMEEIGKTIFKHWFVDFEYENYKTKGGKMIWNANLEKEIPENWEVGKLENYFFETKEKTNSENYEPFSIGVKGCIPRNKIYKKSIAKSLKKNKIIKNGDLIFGLGTNKVIYGFMKENSGCVSSAYFVFRLKKIWMKSFFENIFVFNKYFFDDILKPTSRQGQTIDAKMFFKKYIYIPPKEILEIFNQKMKPFFEKMLENQKENEILKEMRDTLLPKLIKGEIRIK